MHRLCKILFFMHSPYTTISNIIISQEAVDYIRIEKRMKRPNLVIYRDIQTISCCSSKIFDFVAKVKAIDGKEPNELFVVIDNVQGIPIWVERALLSQINDASNCVMISLKKWLVKGLKLMILEKRMT